MSKNLALFATASGGLGILIALVAILARLVGMRYIAGVESISLLIAAIALMTASCVVQLHLLRTR